MELQIYTNQYPQVKMHFTNPLQYLLYHLPEKKGNYDEAWKLFSNEEFENSLVQFKLAYDMQNPDVLILQAIAICEYQLFKYREALITINKALELQDEPVILQTKASILTELSKKDKDEKLMLIAKSLYEKILIGDRNSTILCNYGNCLYNLKNINDAIRIYEEALGLNPNNAEAWNCLGNAYNEVGLSQNAIKCFDNAQLVNPELMQAVFNKGQTIYTKFRNPILGLEFMLHATHMDKSNTFELEFPYIYFWISEAFLEVGDFQNALQMNSKGLEIYPSDICFNKQRDRIQQVINWCS
ncbi:MAG: tetratricopeptide repeat protein [Bacteroidetes bacterium]|nr:tetratricopeptide repeat protein [Bacteroidota bacterium]